MGLPRTPPALPAGDDAATLPCRELEAAAARNNQRRQRLRPPVTLAPPPRPPDALPGRGIALARAAAPRAPANHSQLIILSGGVAGGCMPRRARRRGCGRACSRSRTTTGAPTGAAARAGLTGAKRGVKKRFIARHGRPETAALLFPGLRCRESDRDLRDGDGSRQRETARDKAARQIDTGERAVLFVVVVVVHPCVGHTVLQRYLHQRKQQQQQPVRTGLYGLLLYRTKRLKIG